MENFFLLNKLIDDEKNINKKLYSSGPYWNYKNSKSIIEIKKKGIKDFRGLSAGVGTSFADNLVFDIRNELNVKGRIISKLYSLPIIKKIFEGQLKITEGHLKSFLNLESLVYKIAKIFKFN